MSLVAQNIKILAIIPARGGSKGLPRKNILPLLGKPLIAWTIEAALASNVIDHVFVSTDDDEISAISKTFGAQVLRRPAELATDTASSDALITHAIREVDIIGLCFTHVCLLQPTSPLRTYEHIHAAVTILENENSGCVISVFKPKYSIAKAYQLLSDGTLVGLFSLDAPYTARQKLPEAFFPNGAIYLFSRNDFLIKNQIPRDSITPYVMQEADSIDIDDQKDLEIAQKILTGEKNV